MPELDQTESKTDDASDSAQDYIVDEATDSVLRLHLREFQGPLEVLLYLIKSQEIDIFDIPIASITQQYLEFLGLMERENLEIAGDYLVMAATLIQIKSKMLIPVDIDEDDEEIEEGDPRMELVEKLIAYRMYRDVAGRLEGLEADRANCFTRNVKPAFDVVDEEEEEEYIEVSLFDLGQAFRGVLRFLHDDTPHTIHNEPASVDEKIEYIQTILGIQDSVAWMDLFRASKTRIEAVCSFLAILELCRMGVVRAHQHAAFGDIRLFRSIRTESHAA